MDMKMSFFFFFLFLSSSLLPECMEENVVSHLVRSWLMAEDVCVEAQPAASLSEFSEQGNVF